MPEPVIELAEQFRAALIAKDLAAQKRLIQAYVSMYNRLKGKVDLLLAQIGQDTPTAGQVARLSRYKQLMEQAATELAGYQVIATNETEAAMRAAITLGPKEARLLMAETIGAPGVAGVFNTLPKGAIEQIIGFLDPGGPLYARLQLLAPYTTEQVSKAIIDGVGLGFNPAKTARAIENAFGLGLSDALRTVRTAQIWAYRESSRATYIANSEVVSGWVWHANLRDGRTCASCINMHGTEHPLSEPLNDHYNGRCSAIPLVRGFPNPVTETGQEWFEKQSEAEQKKYLGQSKWQAWKDGKFSFADLTAEQDNDVYGKMRSERSLKDLLGQ